jgi:hypothetical protein
MDHHCKDIGGPIPIKGSFSFIYLITLSRPSTDMNLLAIIYTAEDINPSTQLDPTYKVAATALKQNVL